MSPADRRNRPPATAGRVFVNCRVCWERIKLEPARVEPLETGFAYRCQHCDSSFLIRDEDADAIGAKRPDLE